MKVTFNSEQGLFVIPSGKGFSCLGLEVCRKRASALHQELGEGLACDYQDRRWESALHLYADYQRLVDKARAKHDSTGWRSSSELTPDFVGMEGKRVEVRHEWPSGRVEVSRFIVGKSTGFIPCHLAIARRNSNGGPAVCLGKIKSVQVIA